MLRFYDIMQTESIKEDRSMDQHNGKNISFEEPALADEQLTQASGGAATTVKACRICGRPVDGNPRDGLCKDCHVVFKPL